MDDFSSLALQFEWGVDETLDLAPIGRFRPIEPAPTTLGPAARIASSPVAPVALQGTPGERALAAAARSATLDELRSALAEFDGCALRDTATNLVFAEGDPNADTMIVGEPPGREEDRSGHPFAGAEGQLLDAMLISIGLTRGEMLVSPLLPWRPPGGRPPSPSEIAICLPFLNRVIALAKPRRLLILGATATKALLSPGQGRRRGQPVWIEIRIPGVSAPIVALCLPSLAEMMKTPPLRKETWAGLRLLRRAIDEVSTKV